MDSILINRRTPEDTTIDDLINMNHKLANKHIDLLYEKIEKHDNKKNSGLLGFLNDIRPDKNDIVIGDTFIEWSIKPGVNLGKLIKGQTVESLEKTKIHIAISEKMTDDSELFCIIDGKPFKINHDGSVGDYDVKAGGTLRF